MCLYLIGAYFSLFQGVLISPAQSGHQWLTHYTTNYKYIRMYRCIYHKTNSCGGTVHFTIIYVWYSVFVNIRARDTNLFEVAMATSNRPCGTFYVQVYTTDALYNLEKNVFFLYWYYPPYC